MADARANILITAEDRTKAAFDSVAKSFETLKRIAETVLVSEFVKKVVEAGAEAEQAANRLTAAYRLQSQQIGITRKELDDLAESMAAATQFNDNDFKRGEAELIKFGNIYGDVFTRALSLSADLAAFNKTDLPSATDALGKALANPIDGVKGLGAAIGKLNAEERDHIKTLVEQNRGLEAQNFILDRVQKNIGGTAALMNSGYTKAIEDTAKAWDKFKESLAGIVIIKDTVVGALEAIAAALRGISSIFQGGTFAEGELGKQTAMAKQITDLEFEIQQRKSRKGLTFTDDEGRVIGEDLRVDELEAKLKALNEQYQKIYAPKPEAKAAGKPDFGLTQEQLAFLKTLKKQGNSVGDQGPVAGLFATADELHLGEQTHLLIQKLGQAIQEEADQAARAKEFIRGWKEAFGFQKDIKDEIAAIQLRTHLIGFDAGQVAKLTRLQQLDNQVRDASVQMTEEQAKAFRELAEVLRNDLGDAMDESYKISRRATTGFIEGISEVYDTATNSAAQAHDFTVNAFNGMTEAISAFVKTGKLDFHSLADSIISDLIRIMIQQRITAPLAAALTGSEGALGGFFNFVSGGPAPSVGSTSATFNSSMYIPARAGGGDVAANEPYWVGERGRELFVPDSNGRVVANGKAGGGTYYIDARGADQAGLARLEGMIRQINGSIEPRAIGAVAQARQRGTAGLR